MKTIIVELANTQELSHFHWCEAESRTDYRIKEAMHEMHSHTVTTTSDPLQAACWIFDIDETMIEGLIDSLKHIHKLFKTHGMFAWHESKREIL